MNLNRQGEVHYFRFDRYFLSVSEPSASQAEGADWVTVTRCCVIGMDEPPSPARCALFVKKRTARAVNWQARWARPSRSWRAQGGKEGWGVHVLSIGVREGDSDEMIRFMYPWVHETPVSHLETESYLEIYWIL